MTDLERTGAFVRRVDVDVAALVVWCRDRDLPVDGPARAKYAAACLQEKKEILPCP